MVVDQIPVICLMEADESPLWALYDEMVVIRASDWEYISERPFNRTAFKRAVASVISNTSVKVVLILYQNDEIGILILDKHGMPLRVNTDEIYREYIAEVMLQ